MAERVGQCLGNYQLLRLLGRGAFAEVYLAEHRYLEVPAAIKVLHVRVEPDTQQQFLREARTIARLEHPHIVRVHDFGFQDEIPYLVMEYTANGTLRARHPKGTRLSLEQIISYVKQIAPALDYAHEQRVIHRDIKPENILLNTNDEVVLSDFGIAVIQQSRDSLITQNQAGTPIYMAPEQIQGKATAASDQYALGVLVYEWLCGEPPFRGTLFEVFSQHLHESPPSLCDRVPSLPPAVEDAVFGALAKEPQARFVSVQDFADVLEEVYDSTQPLSLSLSSELLAQEQIYPPDTLSLPLHAPSPEEQDRSLSTTKTLTLAPGQTANSKARVALSQHTEVSVSRTNRQRLLKKVRTFWIAGVLEHSLHGNALVALGLEELPDAVANPWQLVLHHLAGEPRPLPAGTRITEAYDAANGELLILGAPGSGKTTLLLELTRDLLNRAERDEQHLMPVVFNLSSWPIKQQRLADWLVEELSSTYQVPHTLGQTLVEAEQILPLLDGLDEVAPGNRTVCIEAINIYLQEHGLLPLVVCSRSADYQAQTARVQLGSAVAVQPLTQQQVEGSLARGGEPLRALRVMLQQDAALRELTSTPLMLSILTLTYRGMPVADLFAGVSARDQQRQIFAHYVERMLRRRGQEMRSTPEQTMHWLSWLARQMKQQNQTVFYIEHLQPTWLSGEPMRRAYDRWAVRFPAVLMGILISLTINSLFSPFLSFTSLVLNIVLGGSVGWLLSAGSTIRQSYGRNKRVKRSTGSRPVGRLRTGAIIGLAAGLLTGLSSALFGWLRFGPMGALGTGLGTGLSFGLSFGLIGGLLSRLLTGKPADISLTDELIWSRKSLGRSLLAKRHVYTALCVMALIGLSVGLSDGLIRSLIIGQSYGLSAGLFFGLSAGLGAGLSYWLVVGLFQGVSSETIGDQRRVVPNQGIRRSARNSLVFALISAGIVPLILVCSTGLIVGLSFALFRGPPIFLDFYVPSKRLGELVVYASSGGLYGEYGELSTGLNPTLASALEIVFIPGLLAALLSGGGACLRHYVVRFLLWRVGSIPGNYSRFLDAAAERVLLRKVGGGYIFTHRLLLEYFASLERIPSADAARVRKWPAQPVP